MSLTRTHTDTHRDTYLYYNNLNNSTTESDKLPTAHIDFTLPNGLFKNWNCINWIPSLISLLLRQQSRCSTTTPMHRKRPSLWRSKLQPQHRMQQARLDKSDSSRRANAAPASSTMAAPEPQHPAWAATRPGSQASYRASTTRAIFWTWMLIRCQLAPIRASMIDLTTSTTLDAKTTAVI